MSEAPSRPSLSPLFAAALFAWMCVLCIEHITWLLFTEELSSEQIIQGGIIGVSVLVVVAVIVMRLSKSHAKLNVAPISRSALAIICVSIIVSILSASLYWASWRTDIDNLQGIIEQSDTIEIELTSDPAVRDYGTVSNGEISVGAHKMQVRLIWPQNTETQFAGHLLSVKGSVLSPQTSDSGRWSHQNGYVGSIKASSAEELGYANSFRGFVTSFRDSSFQRIKALEGESSGLLAGILLGNKTLYAGSELELAFQTTGLAHLMAVSGTHLAIVTMLLSALLGKTALKRRVRSVLLICALLFYVAITGFAPSAMRACTMCTVAIVAGSLKRRADILSALALCAFVFIGLSPNIIFSVGFQLSVLAVLGLVLFGNLATSWIAKIAPVLPNSIQSSLGATVTASYITLPITVPLFAQLPIISPLANFVVAPLITAALCVGMIGIVAGAIIAPIGAVILQIAGIIAAISARIVHFLADIPGACLPLSSGSSLIAFCFAAFFIGLWIMWPVPKNSNPTNATSHEFQTPNILRSISKMTCACSIIALPLLLTFFIGFGQFSIGNTPSDSKLVMLDVGQGDSILIQSGDSSVLVDTGEKSDVLIRELAEKSVSHLNAIFISHKDADHAGALSKLAGIVDIEHVYVHKDLIGKEFAQSVLDAARWVTDGKGAEGVAPNFSVQVGEFTLTVIAPEDGGKSANDDSLIILVEFDAQNNGSIEARGILTGDGEENAMKNVVSKVGDIDFLKVAHHGSKGGLSDDQLKELSPELALISVGEGNKFGHPTQETLQMLKRAQAKIYRTDQQGAISVYFTEEGMSVLTEK